MPFNCLDEVKMIQELADARNALAKVDNIITVFGSARTKKTNKYYKEAVIFGAWAAAKGFNILTGGGPGIMEAANAGAKDDFDSVSIGLNISLPFEQTPNPYIDPGYSIDFKYFAARKIKMIDKSVACAFFPGGLGTLDELFEVLTLIQCNKMQRIPVVLVGHEFFNTVIDWDYLVRIGTISADDLELFKVVDSGEDAIRYLLEVL